MNGFTEEQRTQLKKLNRKYALKALGMVAKGFVALVVANLLVGAADVFYVHSKFFVFVMSFGSGFAFGKLLIDNFVILGENLKADTLKILEEKSEK